MIDAMTWAPSHPRPASSTGATEDNDESSCTNVDCFERRFRALSSVRLFVALAALLAACSPKPCTETSVTPGTPSPSIECPSGQLCYQGQCLHACNAGAERATPCSSSADCTESTRPRCVSSFCSSCEEGESCIPDLNVCRSVIDIPTPPDPTPSNFPAPPLPLDGGTIDGSSFASDAGEPEPPPPQAVTHQGMIALEEVVDFAQGSTEQARVRISFSDLRRATLTQEGGSTSPIGQCEIEILPIYAPGAAPSPADIGSIQVESHSIAPGSVSTRVDAQFDRTSGRYENTPAPLPEPLLVLSIPAPLGGHFATLSSRGLDMVTDAWPDRGGDLPYHIPYRLRPDPATTALMSQTIRINAPPTDPQDLTFGWELISALDAIRGEKVVVEIFGAAHTLHCELDETVPGTPIGQILVPSALLIEFILRENIPRGGGTIVPFALERVFEQLLPIPGDAAAMTVVRGTIRLSHRFLGQIEF